MSGTDLRKFMNLMESITIAVSDDKSVVEDAEPINEDRLDMIYDSTETFFDELDPSKENGVETVPGEVFSVQISYVRIPNDDDANIAAGIKAAKKQAGGGRFVLSDYTSNDAGGIWAFVVKIPKGVEETVEQIDEGIRGMDLDAVLWKIFEYGSRYGTTNMSSFYNKADELIGQLIEACGLSVPREPVAEETLEETGNANAQQKGINFSGTPAKKNSGDMSLSSPKSKGPGSKTPLAQAKSGTNVGQKKA